MQLQLLLVVWSAFVTMSLLSLHYVYIEINNIESIPNITLTKNTNCSNFWRDQHQIPINNKTLMTLIDAKWLPFGYMMYDFNKIPKGTFIWWLSHIESQNAVVKKAYFADKYVVKKYIDDYKQQYPQFDFINRAEILFDFSKKKRRPFYISFDKIIELKQKHKAFVVKPNHFSGKKIIVQPTNNFTIVQYDRTMKEIRFWGKHKYKVKSNRINRESWYELIKPRIFIEEYLNIDHEYKINVFNYNALFLYVYQKKKATGNPINIYLLPEFKLLNVTWHTPIDMNYIVTKPLNLDKMIEFAEQFAKKEKFRYLRVDLYQVGNKVYFSEFTFAPMSGVAVIQPISFDYLLYGIICGDNSQKEKMYQYIL